MASKEDEVKHYNRLTLVYEQSSSLETLDEFVKFLKVNVNKLIVQIKNIN